MTIRHQGLAVTHDGSFHADEVFAAAILDLARDGIEVTRTRDPQVAATAEIVFDVGGIYDPADQRYDHHMVDAPVRPDGTPYSSAGLIWRDFGRQAIEHSGAAADTSGILDTIWSRIDEDLIRTIDRVDNGVQEVGPTDLIMVIDHMNPTHLEAGDNAHALTCRAFVRATVFARDVLIRMFHHAAAEIHGEAILLEGLTNSDDPRIAVLDVNVPWQKAVFRNNLAYLLYVVAPSGTKGQWGVTAIPVEEGSFTNRKPFAKDWAGLIDTALQEVTGVADARFCHRNLFFAVADSRQGALELARKSAAA
jgi:uncharacterized UPF0160 family protein